jgi:hypothetical protein
MRATGRGRTRSNDLSGVVDVRHPRIHAPKVPKSTIPSACDHANGCEPLLPITSPLAFTSTALLVA